MAVHRLKDGYTPHIVRHRDYGGASNAVHLILVKREPQTLSPPTSTLRRVVKHFVNAAARGVFPAIASPATLAPPLRHDPIVVDGLGWIEGLFDAAHQEREYAIPCVFKPTGLVRRRLTPVEWLHLHDIPGEMVDSLATHAFAWQAIALGVSPLVINFFLSSLWGVLGGGTPRLLRRAATRLRGRCSPS